MDVETSVVEGLYKLRNDLSVSDDASETLSIEIINKHVKNIIVSNCYRPPAAKVSSFEKYITHITDKLIRENKKLFIVGDFNINCLDYTTNSKTKKFMNHMFSKGMLSVVNRPTRVTKTSSSCIDHIYINSYFDRDILSGIIKTDLTDHFPIFIKSNEPMDYKGSCEVIKT